MDSVLKSAVEEYLVVDRFVRERVLWGGYRFEVYDISTAEDIGTRGGLFKVSPNISSLGRDLWEKVPAGMRATLAAGVLVPVSLVSLRAGLVFPDLDIRLLGIGWHRYFLFHSGAAVWLLREFWESYQKWVDGGKVPSLLTKVVGTVATCGAVGVALHLAKDALIDGDKSIVFGIPGLGKVGSLVRGTLMDDDLWLLGNSVWAFKLAGDVVAVTFGEELQAAREFVKKEFAWGGFSGGDRG